MTPITLRLNFSLVGLPIPSYRNLQPMLAADEQTYFTASVSQLIYGIGAQGGHQGRLSFGAEYLLEELLIAWTDNQHGGVSEESSDPQGRVGAPSYWSQRTARLHALWLVSRACNHAVPDSWAPGEDTWDPARLWGKGEVGHIWLRCTHYLGSALMAWGLAARICELPWGK